jgi:AcrR family transcriptional regulator
VDLLLDIAPKWRKPTQQRSRDRVDAILGAARRLISKGGIADLKMRELSEAAGVPMGTIYQFFPDKDAVVACIFARQMEEALQALQNAYSSGTSIAEILNSTDGFAESLYKRWRNDRVMAEIWSIVQANRTLRHYAVASSRVSADIISKALKPYLKKGVSTSRLWHVCFLNSDLYDSAIRTALDFSDREALTLIKEYALMSRRHLIGLLDKRRK